MPTATTSISTAAGNFNISIIDGLYDMRFAWEKVTEKTIKNCFHHAGFHISFASEREVEETAQSSETEASHNEPESLLNSLSKVKGADFETTAEEYLAIDYEVQTTAEMSISEIVNNIQSQDNQWSLAPKTSRRGKVCKK
ncbi:hypothetical protein PoB_004465300 [Plakobranchus ocellatus]|uniref:Uncharacterized protein n=1 Tax=Plakobranchus ocellatus TaxID=259542 RepID=A0AAV4BH22_9GAST|nr:hypothetical protein PoB_004465300 [Plakobranchus ocellatus]